MNMMRTALLLAAMTALFLAVGYLIAGESGALIAFVIALAMNGWAYWNSDKMVLRMHNARPVTTPRRRIWSGWSSSWPGARSCPCPPSTCWRATSRTRSPSAATPKTARSR